MADEGFDNLPERGGEEEALLRFLAQFGITPGPDGRLDLEGLMTQLQPLMSNLTAQLASFGKSDASGMNWGFTRATVRSTASASPWSQ